jgi:5S rRNA maturation endonuclease (ribonuclease M5)
MRQQCPLCLEKHLDVTVKNGKTLVTCWTDGCAGQTNDGRVKILKKLGLGQSTSGFTVAEFCQMKRLPLEWAVEHFHIRDDHYVGKSGKPSKDVSVAFPYVDLDGKLVGTHFRFSKSSKDSAWHEYDKEGIVPYGLPQVCAGDIENMVMVVEGESNTMTLQHVCLPAIGIAGAKNWKPRYAEIPFIKDAETIYIFQDPDKDGEDFVRKVSKTFPAGKCRVVQFTEEEEDISALWINSATPSAFADALIVKLRESKIIGAMAEVVQEEPKKDYDLPSAALDGFLGQTCLDHMSDFPRSYAYLALLAVASVHVPMSTRSRCNLYVTMIGDSGFGKTASVQRAARLLSTLLIDEEPNSGEGLAKLLEPYNGRQCLLWQEELCKLLAKARIENSSILAILNKLWGVDTYTGITKKEKTTINARLTVVGGLPTSDFGVAFGAESIGGLYRRELFADQPPDAKPHLWRDPLDYEPVWTPRTIVEGDPHEEQERLLISRPVPVHIAKSVWDARDNWVKSEGVEPHLIEPVLRAAVIAASFDGRRELTADHLEPAYELLKYQVHVRLWLRPNTGLTTDGKLTRTFLNYLRRYAPDGSEVTRRKLLNATNAYDYGSAVARRVLEALERDRMIEFGEKGRGDTVRLHPREIGMK